MLFSLEVAVTTYCLLVAGFAEAGPLKRAFNVARRGDMVAFGNSSYSSSASASASASASTGTTVPTASGPSPIFETLTGTTISIPESLLPAAHGRASSETQGSYSGPLSVIPVTLPSIPPTAGQTFTSSAAALSSSSTTAAEPPSSSRLAGPGQSFTGNRLFICRSQRHSIHECICNCILSCILSRIHYTSERGYDRPVFDHVVCLRAECERFFVSGHNYQRELGGDLDTKCGKQFQQHYVRHSDCNEPGTVYRRTIKRPSDDCIDQLVRSPPGTEQQPPTGSTTATTTSAFTTLSPSVAPGDATSQTAGVSEAPPKNVATTRSNVSTLTQPQPQDTTALTTSSPSSSSSSSPVIDTFTPTGTPNGNVPTAITSLPTGTSTVPSEIYASNISQARDLNKLYSSLTPQSACAERQMACINGRMAQCSGGGFNLTDCPGTQKCYALPMMNTQGVKLGCSDPAEAQRILGNGFDLGGGSSSSSRSSASRAVPTTLRTESKRPVLTRTRYVTVTDLSSTSSSAQPADLLPSTTEHAPTSTAAAATTSTSKLPPPLPPPPPPPASSTSSTQPGRIVITQTFSTPGQARTSQLPSTTNDVLPTPNPNSLLLIPVELSNLIPKPAAPTQESNQVAGNGGGGGGGGGGSGGGSGSLNGNPSSSITGAPRTTVVSNGTPTVSVFFTVTVTEKERITETVTATLTLPVATSG
ncbi:uncharacterized protein UV8b_05437 [Ustilaginoidea virens]|uniref:Carbohydrate-binding module family 19 protein n=1 Tax=Ustilaginoidea virens TaxID=1159556 RepID=A0A8E5HU01_USTVR|nr:uncharacterized protein UV8b_05437 [Ustilaginoidea virens]QUC21194.1 hypothetical protein UV8b_05437 [Ustilaginoidea virens]